MGLKEIQPRPKQPPHRDFMPPLDTDARLLEARLETSRWQRYAAALEERVAPSVIAKIKKAIFG